MVVSRNSENSRNTSTRANLLAGNRRYVANAFAVASGFRFSLRSSLIALALFAVATSIVMSIIQRMQLFEFVSNFGGDFYATQPLTGYPFATRLESSADAFSQSELAISFHRNHCWEERLGEDVFRGMKPMARDLRHLQLMRTSLVDYTPLLEFTHLKTLHVTLCETADSEPVDFSAIAKLETLEELLIGRSALAPKITVRLDEIANLRKLVKLELYHPDQITLEKTQGLPQLKSLTIEFDPNSMVPDFHAATKENKTLLELNLSAYPLKSLDLQASKADWLWKFQNLQKLYLDGPIFAELHDLVRLKHLREARLPDHQFSVSDFAEVSKALPELAHLEIPKWTASKTSQDSDWEITIR